MHMHLLTRHSLRRKCPIRLRRGWASLLHQLLPIHNKLEMRLLLAIPTAAEVVEAAVAELTIVIRECNEILRLQAET